MSTGGARPAWGRWIDRARGFAAAPARERRFLMTAWVLARPVSFALARTKFPTVLAWLARLPRPRRRSHAEPCETIGVERGERLVRAAFRASASPGACLEQSIVQYLLHRRFGPEARLVVGVARDRATPSDAGVPASAPDLRAHAWVEEVGRERAEPGFERILVLSPRGGIERVRTGPG